MADTPTLTINATPEEVATKAALIRFMGRKESATLSATQSTALNGYYNARRFLLKEYNKLNTVPSLPSGTTISNRPAIMPKIVAQSIAEMPEAVLTTPTASPIPTPEVETPMSDTINIVGKPTDLELAKKLVQLNTSALSRGYEFNLDLKTVRKLLTQKKCYFTGIEFDTTVDGPNSRTIDRLDNSKGYVIGNVVACTKWFNGAKGSLTIDSVLLLYKGLKKAKLIK